LISTWELYLYSFVIIHFPPLDNNIPATPEYGNYITFEPAVLIQSFNNITVFFLLNYYVDNSNKIILILSFKWFFERYQLHTERYFPSYTRMTRDCAGSKLTTISLLFLSIAFCATGVWHLDEGECRRVSFVELVLDKTSWRIHSSKIAKREYKYMLYIPMWIRYRPSHITEWAELL
jgi:hypothetical protein